MWKTKSWVILLSCIHTTCDSVVKPPNVVSHIVALSSLKCCSSVQWCHYVAVWWNSSTLICSEWHLPCSNKYQYTRYQVSGCYMLFKIARCCATANVSTTKHRRCQNRACRTYSLENTNQVNNLLLKVTYLRLMFLFRLAELPLFVWLLLLKLLIQACHFVLLFC